MGDVLSIHLLSSCRTRTEFKRAQGSHCERNYPTFELEGEADGALAPSVGGKIRTTVSRLYMKPNGV